MLYPCMDALAIKPDGVYVDGTAGGGGHSYEIARRLTTGQLIAIDQDEAAIKAASAKLSPLGERARVVRSNFRHVADVLDMLGIDRIDGILLDLGVSSYQLDTPERGFSYMADAPLDTSALPIIGPPATSLTVLSDLPPQYSTISLNEVPSATFKFLGCLMPKPLTVITVCVRGILFSIAS